MIKRSLAAISAALVLAAAALAGNPAVAAPPVHPTPTGVTVHALKGKGKEVGGKIRKAIPPVTASKKGQVSTFATSCASPCYGYAERNQTFSQPTAATGALATFSVHKPERRSWDYHTLAEMAICDTTHDNCVEAGWTVDNALNGDDNPHFFVFWWLSGVGQGYNTSDFLVSGSAPVTPGQDINSYVGTATLPIQWEHFGAGCGCTQGWWLSNASTFIGVYPDTLWTGAFTSPATVQNFGEVALSQTPSQTDMGNGDIATSAVGTQGAVISNLNILGTGAPAAGYTGGTITYPDRWNRYDSSSVAFRYGGPGGNVTVASTTTPSSHDCSGVGVGTDPSGWGAICAYDGISAGVPITKIKELDGAAGASCRTNWGSTAVGAGTDMIVNSSYKKIDLYSTNNCTGTKLTLGLGRTTLPAPYANATNLSLIVTSSYVTCATGYPTTAPTC